MKGYMLQCYCPILLTVGYAVHGIEKIQYSGQWDCMCRNVAIRQ